MAAAAKATLQKICTTNLISNGQSEDLQAKSPTGPYPLSKNAWGLQELYSQAQLEGHLP